MRKILRWIKYPLSRKKFSFYFYLYKIIFTSTKKRYSKIIDLVHFDSDKSTKLKYIETKIGKFLVFSRDGGISRQLFINKQYNFKSFQKVIKIIGKQDLLIDVGANIGPTCISAINKGYSKKSIAIEPELDCYKILKQNIKINDLENKIRVLNNAVSNKIELLKISKKNENSGASFITKKTSKFELIKSIKLDKFANKIKNKTLIWVDVQGYEGKVIEGSKKIIKKKIPFVIEFWPYAINRNQDRDLVIEGLKRFKHFYDLSIDEKKTICSNENIKKLFFKYNKKKATELLLVNF